MVASRKQSPRTRERQADTNLTATAASGPTEVYCTCIPRGRSMCTLHALNSLLTQLCRYIGGITAILAGVYFVGLAKPDAVFGTDIKHDTDTVKHRTGSERQRVGGPERSEK
ncbi:hypothetical protein BR93DRAFT_927512 [Coniochaeta sp. PMI_546]|nr:hypothetical protein BR93DRAFT_927512 [Coniochaeta sp. PMI_546]